MCAKLQACLFQATHSPSSFHFRCKSLQQTAHKKRHHSRKCHPEAVRLLIYGQSILHRTVSNALTRCHQRDRTIILINIRSVEPLELAARLSFFVLLGLVCPSSGKVIVNFHDRCQCLRRALGRRSPGNAELL